MASDKKCCGGRSCPEVCALIYGYISCIITLLGGLASVALLIYIVIDSFDEEPAIYTDLWQLLLYVGILAILAVLCMIAFGFCILLCKGIVQRNANYVKTYFIFGVCEILLLIIGCGIYRAVKDDPAEIFIGVFAAYGFPLLFVWLTYRKYLPSPAYELCGGKP